MWFWEKNTILTTCDFFRIRLQGLPLVILRETNQGLPPCDYDKIMLTPCDFWGKKALYPLWFCRKKYKAYPLWLWFKKNTTNKATPFEKKYLKRLTPCDFEKKIKKRLTPCDFEKTTNLTPCDFEGKKQQQPLVILNKNRLSLLIFFEKIQGYPLWFLGKNKVLEFLYKINLKKW